MGPLCPDSEPPGLGQSLCRYSFRSFPRDSEGIPGLLPLPVWGNVNLFFFPVGEGESSDFHISLWFADFSLSSPVSSTFPSWGTIASC